MRSRHRIPLTALPFGLRMSVCLSICTSTDFSNRSVHQLEQGYRLRYKMSEYVTERAGGISEYSDTLQLTYLQFLHFN